MATLNVNYGAKTSLQGVQNPKRVTEVSAIKNKYK